MLTCSTPPRARSASTSAPTRTACPTRTSWSPGMPGVARLVDWSTMSHTFPITFECDLDANEAWAQASVYMVGAGFRERVYTIELEAERWDTDVKGFVPYDTNELLEAALQPLRQALSHSTEPYVKKLGKNLLD